MFLSAKEASDFLRISKSNLYQLTRCNKLKFYKPNGKNLYFKKEDLIDYIKGGKDE
ncbi:MAG: helix-turn-helix domain-containing protein [Sporocytophaga sp.]|uniref:helix-turn-helix domain-containing protein n=1 Tax=Sporocytophaga sp. TaxID=2231183 RepID=UPI001B10FBCB|nr:helix-turn-helix domain-containing protein [Sporocytophaga sp.]